MLQMICPNERLAVQLAKEWVVRLARFCDQNVCQPSCLLEVYFECVRFKTKREANKKASGAWKWTYGMTTK